ncbi:MULTISPECIES: YrvL family regulatory protein [unclassified Sporosarcina]|uniref:YrvL family regulatory protein n=1 Tax=unclassified Sporosarcina TaxID=2647733 RepID=UPI00117DF1F9|nr:MULTISPECIES: YrvL family regulatory protein [unclassified Sporosarcina]
MIVLQLRDKIIIGVAMTLLVAVSIGIVFGGIIFGLVGFFSLIGVSYESIGSLLLFIFFAFLVGIFFEILEQITLFFITRANLTSKEKWIWIALIKFILSWIVIYIVNELMTTVVLSSLAVFLTALLIVSIDIVFDDKKR